MTICGVNTASTRFAGFIDCLPVAQEPNGSVVFANNHCFYVFFHLWSNLFFLFVQTFFCVYFTAAVHALNTSNMRSRQLAPKLNPINRDIIIVCELHYLILTYTNKRLLQLLDGSGSVSDESLELEKEWAMGLIAKLDPESRVGVIVFGSNSETVCSLTTDREVLSTAIKSMLRIFNIHCINIMLALRRDHGNTHPEYALGECINDFSDSK